MKTIEQIKNELGRQFEKRLKLRQERKLKKICRNCKLHKDLEIDLGDFGKQVRYVCSEHYDCKQDCPYFKAMHTEESIKKEMIEEIKDPSVCGAKEPKIAALLWVLHEDSESEDTIDQKQSNVSENDRRGIFAWLGSLFK